MDSRTWFVEVEDEPGSRLLVSLSSYLLHYG
jgi:hypothetical protein